MAKDKDDAKDAPQVVGESDAVNAETTSPATPHEDLAKGGDHPVVDPTTSHDEVVEAKQSFKDEHPEQFGAITDDNASVGPQPGQVETTAADQDPPVNPNMPPPGIYVP